MKDRLKQKLFHCKVDPNFAAVNKWPQVVTPTDQQTDKVKRRVVSSQLKLSSNFLDIFQTQDIFS